MRRLVIAAALIGTGALALPSLIGAQAEPTSNRPAQCFFSQDWRGWKASPDSKSIYINVSNRRIYRLDLAQSCPELQSGSAHLITKLTGTSICTALDIDLKVGEGQGFAVPCIVSNLTPLTDEEAAALPKKLRP
jgi:hypothetical protein